MAEYGERSMWCWKRKTAVIESWTASKVGKENENHSCHYISSDNFNCRDCTCMWVCRLAKLIFNWRAPLKKKIVMFSLPEYYMLLCILPKEKKTALIFNTADGNSSALFYGKRESFPQILTLVFWDLNKRKDAFLMDVYVSCRELLIKRFSRNCKVNFVVISSPIW